MRQHNEFFSCRIKDTAVATCAVPVYYYNIWHTSAIFSAMKENLPWGVTIKKQDTIPLNLKTLIGLKYSSQIELESVMGKCASLMKTCVFSTTHMSYWVVEVHWLSDPKDFNDVLRGVRELTNNLTIKKPYHSERHPHNHKAQTKLSLEWISL